MEWVYFATSFCKNTACGEHQKANSEIFTKDYKGPERACEFPEIAC